MAGHISRARKRELRELNRKAWEGQKGLFPTNSSLDSSLKKNTAVIKKLRTALNADSLPQLLKDFQNTSLEKYLSEVVSGVTEGLSKVKTASDITAAIEVTSALHQRFSKDFTPQLTYALAKGLATPRPEVIKGFTPDQKEREERERLARQRVLLRVAVELWLVGVVRTVEDAISIEDTVVATKGVAGKSATSVVLNVGKKKNPDDAAEPFPIEVLKDMLGRDREHISLPLVVLFVKHFAFDVLGIRSRGATRKNVDEDGATTVEKTKSEGEAEDLGARRGSMVEHASDEEPLTPPPLQAVFRNILTKYMESVKAHIVKEHKYLQEQSVKNAEAYVRSGEIFEDRQANYEKRKKAQETFVGYARTIFETLGMEPPDLKNEDDGRNGSIIIQNGTSMFARGEGDKGIWEDEEERKFYEDLIDLKFKVPPILLEDKKKKQADGTPAVNGAVPVVEEQKPVEVQEEDKASSEDDDDFEFDSEGERIEKKKEEPTEDTSTVIANKTIGAQVDALLIRLPEFTNRDLIDEAAVDFCFLNSKASRNRLLKTLQEIPRGRSDLMPYYARLIATLNKYLPDIGSNMVTYLDKEFRSLHRRKDKDLKEVRSRNARYISELTKFGIVPEHIIFHCLKVSLDDFSRMNIEFLCNIMENCGRYLLRNEKTSPRMTQFLETLHRKKTAQHLGAQEKVLIENAFYYVNPPDRPAIHQKERTPMELYIRKLIYIDLTKRTYIKVIKQLRKLHWEDPAIPAMLLKIFSKVWKIKYNNVFLLAILVGALSRYHSDFAISVVDNVLENIELGLEMNNFKYNQRRIALAKYLGELYNYKMLDSPVIFDALYRMVNFGHEGGMPMPGRFCPLDAPDDFFRIRLVCTLLDTCGQCFDRGNSRKKMDFFLQFFQYYVYTKDPLPMDIEFVLQDTFQMLRPDWKMPTNLDEAGKIFQETVSRTYKSDDKSAMEAEDAEPEEAESDGEDFPELDDQNDNDDDSQHSGEESDSEEHSDEHAIESDSEEENIVVTRPQDQRDPEADAEFDREFAKMMSESIDSRKFERKQLFDVPLPIKKSSTLSTRDTENDADSATAASTPLRHPGTMAFSLLTKKGNKQQTSVIELPSDSSFALAMKDKQQAEREEKQRIKDLVLNYERMEEIHERESLEKHASVNGIQIKIGKQPQRARKLSLSDVNWT